MEVTNNFNPVKTQADEIVQRYTRIRQIMQQSVVEPDPLQKKLFTEQFDNILLHRVWGYTILLAVLFFLFQSIFWLAQYPMDFIDWSFTKLNGWLSRCIAASLVEQSAYRWDARGLKRHPGVHSANHDFVWADNHTGRHRLYGAHLFSQR